MKIAVTGKSGQVATALRERGCAAGHDLAMLGRPELDLTEPSSVVHALRAAAPDIVVSAAAYTAVDRAETERGVVHAVNETGARAVASAAKALGIALIHLSTDYVFDGTLDRPYLETDPPGAMSVYGASKLAGEQAVLAEQGPDTVILRLAWIYSPFGSNFVKTMLRLAVDRDEISVVADQFGNPTSAVDIADGILRIATNLARSDDPAMRGVFHMAGEGEASWADFAESIFAASAEHAGPWAHVRRIPTADYPTAAARPANSRLDCGLLKRVHDIALPDWRASLQAVVARLQA